MGYGLAAFVPNSRPEHPKHKGGFEKIGVTADIKSNSIVAVDLAYQMTLSQLLEKNGHKDKIAKEIVTTTSRINQVLLEQVASAREYADLTGQYSDQYKIILDSGQLKLASASGRKYPLRETDKDLFELVYSRSGQKIRIERDDHRHLKGISISSDKGLAPWKFKQYLSD
jgi:hypothetical protein